MRIAEVERVAAELGRHSYRVVCARELVAAKVDMSVVAALVRAGRWQVLWRGVYFCSATGVGAVVRAHAAMKHVGLRKPTERPQPRPVLSGLAGCAAMGMRWVPEHVRVQVLVGPEVQRRSNESVLVRRTWDVQCVSTWDWAGVAVADASRLVVDGARECTSLRVVRGLALAAIADGLTSAEALARLLDAGAKANTALLRRAVVDASRGAVSPPEAEVVDRLMGLRIPFVVNAEIWVGDVFLGIFDAYLLGMGVGVEVDSLEWHGQAATLQETLDRHERASRAGLSLVHVTPGRFRADPAAFEARVLGALADRAGRGLGEPAGLQVRKAGRVLP